MESKITHIIKSSGNVEAFSVEKLRTSLKRAGADDTTVEEIATEVVGNLYEGITTRKIYQLAFRLLNKRRNRPAAAKYSIKRAVMDLGPSGFPFEKYIGFLFEHLGYKVSLNQIRQGTCVSHEIDIIAENENSICIIECKFHNLQGTVCDIKVPLYVHSRFRDTIANILPTKKEYQCWIVTNTKFSADSLQYGSCSGQHLLSWDNPEKDNLKELINRFKLYPVSCLTSITKREKQLLLESGIVLCKEILPNVSALSNINISAARITSIVAEVMNLA